MHALSYDDNATAMIIGTGLMGQHLAKNAAGWLGLHKLIVVDFASSINVNGRQQSIHEFAEDMAADTDHQTQVVAETLDVADETAVSALFERHQNIRYFLYTAGISPSPLVAPENVTKQDVLAAYEVNLWGAQNLLKQGIIRQAFAPRTNGVFILSTSATVGSEGRASSAYETSKGGLLNLITLQSRYFLETHGLVLNGLAPSPLRGPMAAQNPVSAARLDSVEEQMPMGGLTTPAHIAAATMYFWANECWSVGEVLTIDGGYTKHRPVYGELTPKS